MGPAPKKPNPLAIQPKPGFEHPQFPTVGEKEPKGTVRSQIDTRTPLGPARQNVILGVQQPGQSLDGATRGYTPGLLSSLTGDASRAAAARAAADTTKNALRQSMEDVNQKYRQQAEKSRGDDVLAQRQNVMDNFRANKLFEVYGVDIRTDFTQKVKELAAYYEREKKNSQAMITAAMMRMLGGLI